MEIVTQHQGNESAELKIRGRLDGYWADHLTAELDKRVREGTHRLWLDLAEVTYLSSVGIGALVRFYKQLKGLGGSLKVVNPSEPVKEVLEVSGLVQLLVGEPPARKARGETTWHLRAPVRGIVLERMQGLFETFQYQTDTPLKCRLVGDPSRLRGCRFREADCPGVALSAEAFALGVGALGRSFEDCRSRFGELLAVGGVAAYLPSDGTNVPDYLMLGPATAANVRLCYGIVCEGDFTCLTRFETKGEAGPIALTEIVTAALELCRTDAVGLVLIAESVGLMGASLRRSPATEAEAEADAPFAHPQVREWLTFTGERAFRSSTTIVVGVAARREPGPLAAMLRPVGREPQPVGHFHAAAFSHRILPKGQIDLKETVDSLFGSQHLQGVLHLLGDYRVPAGVGESEFVRGACWMAPLTL